MLVSRNFTVLRTERINPEGFDTMSKKLIYWIKPFLPILHFTLVLSSILRSPHWKALEHFVKDVPRKFTGEQLYWSLFFNKVAGGRPKTLSKNNSSTGIFLCVL